MPGIDGELEQYRANAPTLKGNNTRSPPVPPAPLGGSTCGRGPDGGGEFWVRNPAGVGQRNSAVWPDHESRGNRANIEPLGESGLGEPNWIANAKRIGLLFHARERQVRIDGDSYDTLPFGVQPIQDRHLVTARDTPLGPKREHNNLSRRLRETKYAAVGEFHTYIADRVTGAGGRARPIELV
jgi:hypothetical protein